MTATVDQLLDTIEKTASDNLKALAAEDLLGEKDSSVCRQIWRSIRLQIGYDIRAKKLSSLSKTEQNWLSYILAASVPRLRNQYLGMMDAAGRRNGEQLSNEAYGHFAKLSMQHMMGLRTLYVAMNPASAKPSKDGAPAYANAAFHTEDEKTRIADPLVNSSAPALEASQPARDPQAWRTNDTWLFTDVCYHHHCCHDDGFWFWYGFHEASQGRSHFNGFDPLVGGGYGDGYVTYQLFELIGRGLSATSDALLTWGSEVTQNFGRMLQGITIPEINWEPVGKAFVKFGSELAKLGNGTAHVLSNIGNGVGSSLQAVGNVFSGGFHAISSLFDGDGDGWGEICGGIFGVGGTGATVAAGSGGEEQAAENTSDMLSRSTTNLTGNDPVSSAVVTDIKLISFVLYCLIIVPTIARKMWDDVKHMGGATKRWWKKRPVDFDRWHGWRLTAQTVGATAMFLFGFFVPLGGPHTAVVLCLFGMWAGQRLSEIFVGRANRKAHEGVQNYRQQELSSWQLSSLKEQNVAPGSAAKICRILGRFAEESKVQTKQDMSLGWKISNYIWGIYPRGKNHNLARRAIHELKTGNTSGVRTKLSTLGVEVDDQLNITSVDEDSVVTGLSA